MKTNGAQRTGKSRGDGVLFAAAVIAVIAAVFAPDPFFAAEGLIWLLFASWGIMFLQREAKEDLLPVTIALPILLVSLLGVMLFDGIADFFQELFGTDKTETIKILGLGISGVIAVYGFAILNRRAKAQDDANELTRFNSAVEHLANEQSSARVASFYEFLYLAKDVPDYTENILGILSAYLHGISNDAESKVLPAEKQALVNVLFSAEARNAFGQFNYDLQGVNLVGIQFQKMHSPKQKVDFSSADLSGANFTGTILKGFNFQGAVLNGAKLEGADLFQVRLFGADLSNANLYEAKLAGAILSGANFSGAVLSRSDFSGAELSGADFSGAELLRANFSGAGLLGANFSGAGLLRANFSGADLREADFQKTAYLDDTILSGAKYNSATVFPDGFNIPEDMIEEE